jgi:hypothetical protein
MASRRISEDKIVSESPHNWWNGGTFKVFALGAGAVLAYAGYHGVSHALDRNPKQYTASTTEFDCTVGTLAAAPVVTGVQVVAEAHVTCAKSPKSATLTVTVLHRDSSKAAWALVGKPKVFTGVPTASGAYVYVPVPCSAGQFQQTYALSGTGADGSVLAYAPVASLPATVVAGECQ